MIYTGDIEGTGIYVNYVTMIYDLKYSSRDDPPGSSPCPIGGGEIGLLGHQKTLTLWSLVFDGLSWLEKKKQKKKKGGRKKKNKRRVR